MMNYEWLLLIVFSAFLIMIAGCASYVPSQSLTTAQEHVIERYQQEMGDKDMFCFTTANFRHGNQFAFYTEQCYVDCLGLPKNQVQVQNEDNGFDLVTKFSNFCKVADKRRKGVDYGTEPLIVR